MEGQGQIHRAAGHHVDGHGLAQSAADAKHYAGENSGAGGGNGHLEDGLHLTGAQGQGSGPQRIGHCPEGGSADADDGGQDHNGQHHHGGKQVGAAGELMGFGARENQLFQPVHGGVQHHHAHQAVDHGGNGGQQLHGGFHQSGRFLPGDLREKHRGEQAQRHAQRNA